MPGTAPNSRLVFVADAAIPDRSAGTAPSTDEVTGTTQVPMPAPASPSAAARGREAGGGLGAYPPFVKQQPGANNRAAGTQQPAGAGHRCPSARQQRSQDHHHGH